MLTKLFVRWPRDSQTSVYLPGASCGGFMVSVGGVAEVRQEHFCDHEYVGVFDVCWYISTFLAMHLLNDGWY
jgi:hypothetical protein